MSPTVQGCYGPTVPGYNAGHATLHGAGHGIAAMIAEELSRYWERTEERLIDQLSREVERVRRTAPHNRYIHEVLDAAEMVIENEDELPMPELLKALRRIVQ